MRRLLLALPLVLAVPLSAQTQFADSAGIYVGIHDLSANGGEVSIGQRQADGFDYGLRVGAYQGTLSVPRFSIEPYGTVASVEVGPEAGYTRRIGAGLLGRVSGSVLYRSVSATTAGLATTDGSDSGYRTSSVQSLTGNLTATVSRPTRLFGSFRLHPTLGVFAETRQVLSFESNLSDLQPEAVTGAGVHLGLPLSFRLFKQDVTLSPAFQIPLTGHTYFGRTYAGAGLRVNF